MEQQPIRDDGPNPEALILIVVGAHLRAEVEDRPLGDRLCEQMKAWLESWGPEEVTLPLVCTDLWYLNAPHLRRRPTVAIGAPEVNAVTAYLANRLPTAMMIDGTLRMHLDPEYVLPQAAMWGTSVEATASALELFVDRYQDEFLRGALRLPRLAT